MKIARQSRLSLYAVAQAYFVAVTDRYSEQATTLEKGHGRIDERAVLTILRLAAQLKFPYLAQVFPITRKNEEVKTSKQSEQTIYGSPCCPWKHLERRTYW